MLLFEIHVILNPDQRKAEMFVKASHLFTSNPSTNPPCENDLPHQFCARTNRAKLPQIRQF
ncbi:MAG: hypothetical protein C5B50_25575 [Verrucomicrobia bacterium]|nr:MAG: hypothetical protein C5B50_25575 [Verrucomicrobiota bacterium]